MLGPNCTNSFYRIPPTAVYRGYSPGSSPGNPGQRPPGLIIPGQPSSKPGKLFVPGQQTVQKQPPTESAELQDIRKKFRPPPGYLSKDKEDGAQGDEGAGPGALSVDNMLKKLETGADKWYVLARYISALASEGLDASMVEELTGLAKVEQNCMTVAADVRMSLVRDGELSDDAIQYYEVPGREKMLYELRFLTGTSRSKAAEYIVDNDLSPYESQDLARAIQENLRRRGDKEGFSTDPEDCLAYKFYRYAVEARENEKVLNYIEKGLDVARTPSAAAALEKLRNETMIAEDNVETRSKVEMVKLMKEDVSYRPIAIAGFFNEISASKLSACPVAKRQGAFGAFNANHGQDTEWVVLPGWNIVQRARKPVALGFRDCHDSIPSVAAKALAPTAEKRKKLKGGALVLVDLDYGSISEDSAYVVEQEDGHLDIVHGVEGLQGVCARVIIMVRPPDQELVLSSLSTLEI